MMSGSIVGYVKSVLARTCWLRPQSSFTTSTRCDCNCDIWSYVREFGALVMDEISLSTVACYLMVSDSRRRNSIDRKRWPFTNYSDSAVSESIILLVASLAICLAGTHNRPTSLVVRPVQPRLRNLAICAEATPCVHDTCAGDRVISNYFAFRP